MTACLPITVPIATLQDRLAPFTIKLVIKPADPNQWELFDPPLNGLLGWGVSTEEISQIIRQGALGMHGFCNWLEVLLVEGEIPEELVEGKLGCLIEAMKTMLVYHVSFFDENQYSNFTKCS